MTRNRKTNKSNFMTGLWQNIEPYFPIVLKVAITIIILFLIFISMAVFLIIREVPDIKDLSTFIPSETTKIYSYDNVVLADLHMEENRVVVPLQKISKSLVDSVIAVEDIRFYSHKGIDLRAIVRAFTVNIFKGSFSQGASTITQQLARNIFLTKRKNFVRKIAEAVIALQIEKYYTKDEILEMYLNQVYWGHNCYGIESATKYYFGKNASNLNVAEGAMLAGILKAPEAFSPYRNLEYAKIRQRVALARLIEYGKISREEAEKFAKKELKFVSKSDKKHKAPYFTSYVVEQLLKKYGQEMVYTKGLKIYTSLDSKMQEKAEAVIDKYIEIGKKRYTPYKGITHNFQEAALLTIDPRTGMIKAMVGGSDYSKNKFNHTTLAQRPPGSSFKPFVYLTALSMGFSPGTVLEDAPLTFRTWDKPYSPKNFTRRFLGSITLMEALQKSINNIAVRIIDLVGPNSVIQTARQLGIKSPLKPVLSLALGSNEVNMLEMTSAYGVLANSGIRLEPVAILKILDRQGNILYKHEFREKRVYDANAINILVMMMKRVVTGGTATGANIAGRHIAGKTGTTDDYKDAWFIGFIPQLATAVWVGNDDNFPMERVTGGSYPAMIWREFMSFAVKNYPAIDFPAPKNLVYEKVCKKTGLLAHANCPSITVPFQATYRPTKYCWYNHNLERWHPQNNRQILPDGWSYNRAIGIKKQEDIEYIITENENEAETEILEDELITENIDLILLETGKDSLDLDEDLDEDLLN